MEVIGSGEMANAKTIRETTVSLAVLFSSFGKFLREIPPSLGEPRHFPRCDPPLRWRQVATTEHDHSWSDFAVFSGSQVTVHRQRTTQLVDVSPPPLIEWLKALPLILKIVKK